MTAALDKKVDKVEGMGLSHEDYTAPEKDDVATLSMFYKPVNDALDAINGEPVRGGVPGKLTKLEKSKEEIRQAIASKGVEVTEQEPLADYAAKITEIPLKINEWQPNPTWWDIEKILREDTENYPYKAITLLNDSHATGELIAGFAYKTSDGKFYDGSKAVTHTWDPAADKICDEGYGTRYVIIYGDAGHPVCNTALSRSQLYILVSNRWKMQSPFSYCLQALTGLDGEPVTMIPVDPRPGYDVQTWAGCYSLQHLRADVSLFVSGMRMYAYCGCLRSIDVDLSNVNSLNRAWQYCSSLHTLTAKTPKATDFSEAWRGCPALRTLKVDMTQATNVTDAFVNCHSLIELDLTSIPINLDLNSCEHLSRNSVNRIINQLRDYSEGVSHTLKLNPIIQVTAEQRAIATNKNWVLA